MVAELPETTPAEAALRTHPEWIAGCVRHPRALGGARADGRATSPPRPPFEPTRCGSTRASGRAAPRRLPPGGRAARGPRARRAVRRLRVPPVGGGPVHAAVAGGDGGGPHARSPAWGTTSSTVCRTGGKTTHLAALMEDEGQIVAVERPRAVRRPPPHRATRMGATAIAVRTADAAPPHGPTTACSSTPRARTSGRSPPARSPLARGRTRGRARRRAAPILDAAAGAVRRAACSSTPRARSRPPRTSSWWTASSPPARLRCRGPAVRRAGLGPSHGGAVPADAPHRTARTASSSLGCDGRRTNDNVISGDVCRRARACGCGPEPPGRYRCGKLHAPLRAAPVCPNCGEHSTIVRIPTPRCTRATLQELDAPAHMTPTAWLRRSWRGFARLGEQVAAVLDAGPRRSTST